MEDEREEGKKILTPPFQATGKAGYVLTLAGTAKYEVEVEGPPSFVNCILLKSRPESKTRGRRRGANDMSLPPSAVFQGILC